MHLSDFPFDHQEVVFSFTSWEFTRPNVIFHPIALKVPKAGWDAAFKVNEFKLRAPPAATEVSEHSRTFKLILRPFIRHLKRNIVKST